MSLTDRRGLPVSTASPGALEQFETALVQFHSYFGDPVETIDAALSETPDFTLGHILRATVLATLAERQFLPEMCKSVEAAQALHAQANEREQLHTVAIRRWLDGDWHGAAHAWEQVLVAYPRDALALQAAHLSDFYRGDARNLRDRVARVLPQWDEDDVSYSYAIGMQAFGLEECNQFARAEETALRALAIEPRDPWAVHAAAHVYEMQGRYDEGINLYTSREADWAPDNGFAFHNWWHLALYHIERKEYAQVLDIFDRHLWAEPCDIALTLLDATALLWRLHLNGVDVGARWQGIAETWAGKVELEAGYYAFNDVHAIAALVAEQRLGEAEQVMARMREAARGQSGSNAAMSREVGVPVGEALIAFGRGHYRDSVARLAEVRSIANRFGGSNAQRDLLDQTLLEAAIRSGEANQARHVLNERFAAKPESPLAWRYLAGLYRAGGDLDRAVRLESKADSLVYPRDVA